MTKIHKCDACGHISRLAKNKITHAKDCKAVKRRAPDRSAALALKKKTPITKLVKRKARSIKAQAESFGLASPAAGATLTREEFIAKLVSVQGTRSLHKFAPQLGVSYQFLGHAIKGDCAPGAKIAAALGYEQVVMFRPGLKPTLKKADERQMALFAGIAQEKADAAAAS